MNFEKLETEAITNFICRVVKSIDYFLKCARNKLNLSEKDLLKKSYFLMRIKSRCIIRKVYEKIVLSLVLDNFQELLGLNKTKTNTG